MTTQAPAITADDVLKASSKTGNTPRWMLHSDYREPFVVMDRVACAMVMRDHLGLSWPAIGRAMKRDHTNVMRGVEKHRGNKEARKTAVALCASLGFEAELYTDE